MTAKKFRKCAEGYSGNRRHFLELEQVENIMFDAGGYGRPTAVVLAGTARA
jgi:hypothetical protein